MELQSKTERLDALRPADITRAAAILRCGGTVAFPTETVYGLGANALSAEAVTKIFAAKQRPGWDPLIVHIADREMLSQVAELSPAGREVHPSSPTIFALIEAFWPGPLTLLLPRTAAVPDAVTSGRPLVGVRMPAHPVALELIRQAGVPIAAPSANTFGHTSPTTAAHVLADLDGRIDAVLDGGPTQIGLESTVAEVSTDGIVVYRPGAITLEMLDCVGVSGGSMGLQPHETGSEGQASSAPKHANGARDYIVPREAPGVAIESLPSPGVGLRHYAPKARLQLVRIPHFRFAGLQDQLIEAVRAGLMREKRVGVMLPDDWIADSAACLYPWGPWDRPDVLARRLFSGLRALDDANASVIVCPLPSGGGIGEALRDRLKKAAK